MIVYEMKIRKEKYDLEESRFEQNMMVNNPQMYKNYMEKKKEEEENGGNKIVWVAPESIEEARELEKIFAELDSHTKKNQDKEADKEFVKNIGLMGLFGGIDIDQMGDE